MRDAPDHPSHPASHPASSAQPLPAWRRWAAGVLAVVGIAMLLLLRQPMSEWLWPATRVEQLRADAAQALLAGELTRADGRGARELYAAALALDPDRPDARDGLARVGRAAMTRATTAFAHGRLDEAREALQLARELDVPRDRTDALQRQLREHAADGAGLDLLLATARAARARGRLDGAADTALPLYQRVLELQPNHVAALEGREDTLADLLQRARSILDQDLVGAGAMIARVQAVDPGHFGLPEARAALAQEVTRTLEKADRDLRAGRLSDALDGYRQVAQVEPDNADAGRGLVDVANTHAAASERLAADFRFVQAQAALLDAQAVAPDAPSVASAQARLARARLAHQRLNRAVAPAQRERRLAELLASASAAEARGDLLVPPGESAYDFLRAARAIAPDDAAVEKASRRVLRFAAECFRSNLSANSLVRAHACLDAWQTLEGGETQDIDDARSRLAARWVAYASERLGAYELEAAATALARARELDPGTPGIDDMATRLRRAGWVSR